MINFEELFCPECTCPMSIENPGTCQNCDYQTEAYHLEHDRHEVPDFTPIETAFVLTALQISRVEKEFREQAFIKAMHHAQAKRTAELQPIGQILRRGTAGFGSTGR
jgi:hypothetical protein